MRVYKKENIERKAAMKAAFTVWNDHMAPVFDVARNFHIVEITNGEIAKERNEVINESMPHIKSIRLREMGIDVLVCGAISRPVHSMVASYGIQVIPFITGEVQEVIKAWIEGRLEQKAFMMPGCRGRGMRRRFRGRHKNRRGGM